MSATTECKNWWMPEDFYLPLCTNRFEPEEGLPSCPVCVTPDRVEIIDTCGIFSYMKISPSDIVKIPSLMEIEFLPGELTTRISHTCNLTAAASTLCQTLIPELVGVQTTFRRTSIATSSIGLWSTPRIPIGTRYFHYNMKNVGTGATIGDKYDTWDLDMQMTMIINFTACTMEFIFDLWKTATTSVSSGIVTGVQACLTSAYSNGTTYLTSDHQRVGGGQNVGSFSIVSMKTSSGSTPFFTEFNTDVSRHSPFALRVGMLHCAHKTLWWHSADVKTFRTGLDGLGGAVCDPRTVDIYPKDSTGFDEPIASPPWRPAVISFKMWGL